MNNWSHDVSRFSNITAMVRKYEIYGLSSLGLSQNTFQRLQVVDSSLYQF